jgi:hypothetical protein
MDDILRFNNELSYVIPEISENSYCSILLFFLGNASDGEAHSED